MKCLKFETISTYLDDELKEKERISIEFHLISCAKCAETLEEMRSLRTAFKSAENYRAPFGFSTRVMSRTAALERKKAPWLVPFFVRFAEAAILLIVITLGIVAGKVMSNSSPAAKTTNIASSLSLDLFDATPPGSLGGAYLAMTEVRNEK
jgi:anti-sigma factor RsiW